MNQPLYAFAVRIAFLLPCLAAFGQSPGATLPETLAAAPWHYERECRAWIAVPPRDLDLRQSDSGPACVAVDFTAMLSAAGVEGAVAPESLALVQYNAETGQPLPYPDYQPDLPLEVPLRFDNGGLRGLSYMYNIASDSQQGDLVWVHRQTGGAPSYYALYFDLIGAVRKPTAVPRPFLGDIDVIYQRDTGLLSSLYHSRPTLGDINADGVPDLLVGNILGHILVYENTGSPEAPAFVTGRLLEADGKILDVEWYAAPELCDWDGDGDPDLIVGCDGGNVVWFENTGEPARPVFAARGSLIAGGQPIVTPSAPCPETPFITRDYVPVPDVVDWDGDGDLDLLVGGYLTGRVFLFENVRNAPGLPELAARGEIRADGEPVDVLWQAAPCAVDLDNDGDLDLVCGTLDQRVHESQATPWPSFFYFENTGNRASPVLERRPFPLDTDIGSLTHPQPVDWDQDGDWDLVVGVSAEVRVLRNAGTSESARFVAEPPLRAPWMPLVTSGFAVPPVDWDADGDMDFILSGTMTAVFLENEQDGNPPVFERRGEVMAAGNVISHEWPLGDDHSFAEPFDWDNDGDLDYVLGNSAGDVWLYRNVGTPQRWDLAAGERLTLQSGEPVHVGMPVDTEMTDFATHSGNRSDPAPGDYDSDGDHDLVVADAYGKVTHFENTGNNAVPAFAAGTEMLSGEGRCVICAIDWDEDGLLDLVVSWVGEGMWLCRNIGTRDRPAFERTRRFDLPWIPYPHPYALDYNRDGDMDLMISSSYSFVFVAERSFLDSGYAEGALLDVELRTPVR